MAVRANNRAAADDRVATLTDLVFARIIGNFLGLGNSRLVLWSGHHAVLIDKTCVEPVYSIF